MQKEFKASFFAKLVILFNEKGWEIDDDQDNKNSLFNKFSELLSTLSEEEQNFIMRLTRDHFLKVDFEDYPKILLHLFNQLHEDIDNINNLFIAPLTHEKEIHRIKSSSLVSYLFKSVDFSYSNITSKLNVIDSINLIHQFRSKINDNPKARLIIVDDYIGSGSTAKSCLNYIRDNFQINKDKIILLSIAAQYVGIEKIRKLGYKVLVYHKLGKGITDNYNRTDKEKYIKLMNNIENKLKVNDDNKLGYKQSEGLISLIRTPNNTFPVYWFDKSFHPFKSPFPRHN